MAEVLHAPTFEDMEAFFRQAKYPLVKYTDMTAEMKEEAMDICITAVEKYPADMDKCTQVGAVRRSNNRIIHWWSGPGFPVANRMSQSGCTASHMITCLVAALHPMLHSNVEDLQAGLKLALSTHSVDTQ
jgi:hypothetical protein